MGPCIELCTRFRNIYSFLVNVLLRIDKVSVQNQSGIPNPSWVHIILERKMPPTPFLQRTFWGGCEWVGFAVGGGWQLPESELFSCANASVHLCRSCPKRHFNLKISNKENFRSVPNASHHPNLLQSFFFFSQTVHFSHIYELHASWQEVRCGSFALTSLWRISRKLHTHFIHANRLFNAEELSVMNEGVSMFWLASKLTNITLACQMSRDFKKERKEKSSYILVTEMD